MNPAAPLFLGHRPACLPVCEAILAIVGICWRWRCRWLPTIVVHPATPLLFPLVPAKILPDCAVVWINWSSWSWWCSGSWWWHGTLRRGWCGRRRRRRRGKRSWRNRECGLWQSCGRATSAYGHTAIILLRLGPRVFHELHIPHAHACLAIVRHRGG